MYFDPKKGIQGSVESEMSRRNFIAGAALAATGAAAMGLAGCSTQPSTFKESPAAIADASSPLNADSYFGKWAFEIPD